MRHLIDIVAALNEARRNPEVNRKVPMLDALRKYAGQNVFVSFTHDVGSQSHGITKDDLYAANKTGQTHNIRGAKLGINPATPHATPLGIYAYPIDYVLSKEGRVEFGAERPYVWVFAPATRVLDLDAYSDADLRRDLGRLRVDKFTEEKAANAARTDTPGGIIWAVTRQKALDRARQRLEAEQEADADRRRDEAYADFLKYQWDEDGEDADEDPEEVFDAQWFDDGAYVSDNDVNERVPAIWNHLFRKLGYGAVSDPKGEGIIHENEPCQAVFFSTTDIRVLELVRNIRPQEPMADDAIFMRQPKALLARIRRGISDEELIRLLDFNGSLVDKVGFENLPEGVRAHMREHASEYFRHMFGSLTPQSIGMNDEQTIRLFANEPGWAATYTAFTPAVQDYVLRHLKDFRRYIDRLPLSDADKMRAFTDEQVYPFVDKQNPSPALQTYMLDHHPDDFMGVMWNYTITPESYVRFLDRMMRTGNLRVHRDGFFAKLLRHDKNYHSDSFEDFLACFAKLPARDAATVAKRLFVLGDRENETIAKQHPLLISAMIRLKPACQTILMADHQIG